MKPPPFDYLAPSTTEDALRALAECGEDGKVLAGGQSLVPLLNFRLARPNTLIDVNRIESLAYIRRCGEVLHIGALTRHAHLERSQLISTHWPVLGEALRFLAHPQIRNRGTVGGSVAHADPSAELPVVLTALGASYVVRSLRATRIIDGTEMFQGPLVSGLAADELLTEIRVPAMAAGAGWAFAEFARRHGDFALGGVAVVAPREAGKVQFAAGSRIVLLAAGATPARAADAELLVTEREFDEALAAQAAAAAASASNPPSDIHGDADYRRELIGSLTKRALLTAWRRSG